ncbi:hypothetical protein BJG93_36610 (plasmid) [Paraburkholderia sprentiae WSM5005]|uniref:Uncharacterized protein n=1 Tax=Paraburkholderia sprentiae WSM5005 TaxID=754502 RepID=A0A8F4KIG5_9BURK|nr:hypothetical protein [Paraburkholderia sprentiae]QXE07372.1 hypothetical protein BJG93_36610 [Paraburkholderia sprentiae WSM5005]
MAFFISERARHAGNGADSIDDDVAVGLGMERTGLGILPAELGLAVCAEDDEPGWQFRLSRGFRRHLFSSCARHAFSR